MNSIARLALFAAEEGHEFQAESKWWPEGSELLWGTLSFLIILFVLIKFAWPPIKKGMATRTERIAKDIDTAARSRADAEALATRITADLRDVDAERGRLLQEAEQTAARVRAEGVARNDAEVVDLEARAEADLAALGGRVNQELQDQVARWSAEAAERIVVSRLDPAVQSDLVEAFIAHVGSNGRA
jgi:F-type H+-transporting ATPase subunit b